MSDWDGGGRGRGERMYNRTDLKQKNQECTLKGNWADECTNSSGTTRTTTGSMKSLID
jgi:hypothetical protein